MDNTLNQEDNISEDSRYLTPYNVDLFSPKPKDYFSEYTRLVLSLPESIRNILMDFSTAEFIEENLGQNFNLTAEQKKEITRIIRDILLGDTYIGDLTAHISDIVGNDPNKAKEIANSIVTNLFASGIEDIKNMQQEKFGDRASQPSDQRTPKPKTDIPNVNVNNVVDLRNKDQ